MVQAASALLTYYFPHPIPVDLAPKGPRTITLGEGAEAWQRRKGIGILTRYLTLGIDGAGPARSGKGRGSETDTHNGALYSQVWGIAWSARDQEASDLEHVNGWNTKPVSQSNMAP